MDFSALFVPLAVWKEWSAISPERLDKGEMEALSLRDNEL